MSIDYYALGQMVCSEGGREMVKLLHQRREDAHRQVFSTTRDKTIPIEAHVQIVKALDSILGTLDKALVAYCKASNAALPAWRREEILKDQNE